MSETYTVQLTAEQLLLLDSILSSHKDIGSEDVRGSKIRKLRRIFLDANKENTNV